MADLKSLTERLRKIAERLCEGYSLRTDLEAIAAALEAMEAQPHPAQPQRIQFDLDSRGEFDETWFANCDVHIERMGDAAFGIGFDLPGDQRVILNTGVYKGVWFFELEEDKAGGGQFVSVQRPGGVQVKLVIDRFVYEAPGLSIVPEADYEAAVLSRHWTSAQLSVGRAVSTSNSADGRCYSIKFVKPATKVEE